MWVGSFGGGIARGNLAGTEFEAFAHDANDPATLSSDRVSVIFEDSAQRLWVGTTTGLNLIDREDGDVVRYAADNEDVSSLSDNDISSIYQDRAGLLWVGTRSHGVNKWNPSSWLYGYEPATTVTVERDREPNVMGFVDDGEGTLWLGTFGDGLNAVDRETGDVVRYRAGADGALQIAGDRVMSLMRDSQGTDLGGNDDERYYPYRSGQAATTTHFRHSEEGESNIH